MRSKLSPRCRHYVGIVLFVIPFITFFFIISTSPSSAVVERNERFTYFATQHYAYILDRKTGEEQDVGYEALPSKDKCGPALLVLCVVHSNAENFLVRQAIRETWASKNSSNSWKYAAKQVFIIGMSTDTQLNNKNFEEAKKYKDMIFYGFTDSQNDRDQIFKSFIMLHYHRHHCPAKLLIKVDESVILHIDRFIAVLSEKVRRSSSFIAGSIISREIPGQKSAGIWGKARIAFADGHIYVISRKSAYEMATNVNERAYIPDAAMFITGSLVKGTRTDLIQIGTGIVTKEHLQASRGCQHNDSVFAVHTNSATPNAYKTIWTSLRHNPCYHDLS